MQLTEIAYAKINLALHVRRRRDDGYHELETLFAFVDAGDRLSAWENARDEITVTGEFATQLSDNQGNIIMQALAILPRNKGLAISLHKALPVAAGLGGGSADAGAIFRLIEALQGLPGDWPALAAKLGADVPACVHSRSCIGTGTGADLELVDNDLADSPVLLVNPRVPLATGPVFEAWDGIDHGPLPCGAVSQIARHGRNDLEIPAISLCPAIADVLAALRDTGADLARMSGSGATCFALYRDERAMQKAAEMLKKSRPQWWQMAGKIR